MPDSLKLLHRHRIGSRNYGVRELSGKSVHGRREKILGREKDEVGKFEHDFGLLTGTGG